MRLAIYPGSFDPITNGHLNLVERSLHIADRLIIAIAHNVKKTSLFSVEERIDLISQSIPEAHRDRVSVDAFDGLLMDFVKDQAAHMVVRGLRAISDFEYEFQMAHMNKRLYGDCETIFMMTGEEHFYVSSNLVREIARFDGNLSGLVPPHVELALKDKYSS
tara:strand:- start:707 stop:1192 length:486 start_codon:yes stop_codon:yes gene_type:complete